MIAKRIQPSTWFKDEPLSQLIKVHSKGAEMQKLAACDSPLARANIRPEKGHAFIHLITTGAGERYGCFFKGAPVQTPDGFTEIQDLQVGDPVMTHKGRYQQISNTFQDRYKGTKVSIKVTGIPVPIESTDNHPFLVVRNKDLSSGLRCYYKKKDTLSEYMAGVLDKASFVAAEDIELGDYMLTPIGNISEDPWEFPPYLLGLYVADGCLFKEYRDIRSKGDVKGVVYTLSKSKRACIDVIQEWRASEEKAAVSVREHGEVLRIQITHKAFADACAMFGASAQTKTIPAGMFKGSVEDRMLFLAGYLDGDGCRAIGKEAGAVRCSTISLELAMDLRRLAASVGLPMVVSACWNRESNGAFGKGDNQIFSCTIPSSYAGVLNKYCRRLKKLGSAKRKATTQYIQDGYIMSAVTHLEYQSVDTTKYNIEVDGDNTYVVLVAGHNSNSNSDYFNKTACLWVYPNPISQTRKEEMLSGGLLSYHNTFMKYGAVYREHNNSKKGASPEGQIVLEAYNPHMDRGELIVKVGEDKWASELADLEAGRPVYFSMGCGVKHDKCSICGNHASTRANYCQHLRYDKLAMDKEGNQVFAINDEPHFHDISKVVKPADRIAFGLAKVASGGYVSDDEEDLSSLWMPMSVITKLSGETEQKRASILDKLSAMEKKILAQGLTPEEDTLAGSFEDMSQEEEEDLVEKLAAYPIESVLTCLNNNKVMLPPRVFACILLHKRASEVPGLGDMTKALRNIFSELRESGDTEILQDGTYSQRSRMMGPSHEIQKIAGRFSLDESAVERRVIHSIIAGSEKTAGLADTTSAESRYLAREYAKYQMSFVTGAGLEKNAHLIVLHNQVAT